MGGDIARLKKARVVIKLAGKLSKSNARALKKELGRVLDKYQKKVRTKTPRRPKRRP